jgi:hypothetical protein
MNYYQRAQNNLAAWIDEDPARVEDFRRLVGDLDLPAYFSKMAHQPDIITTVVKYLMRHETDRVLKRINGPA